MFDSLSYRTEQREAFRADVLSGLSQSQKTLPSRWLYDDRGSELFEEITRLEEYYPTRTETAILSEHAREIADFCGPKTVLLEYGAGAGVKTEILIRALKAPRLYVPIDIAGDFLEQTVARFQQRFSELRVQPVVSDFTADFPLPAWIPEGRRVAFFPGSTIGNLSAVEAGAFLQRLRRQVGQDGAALIGVDLKKDLNVLQAAYDDRRGVTAEFDLNLLLRINRELEGDFVPAWFQHSARWNSAESAMEMHLVSTVGQSVHLGGRTFEFKAGETIHTESSRKYEVKAFKELAAQHGWRTERLWTDERCYFAVFGLA
jgi:L-histidine N-alpha-methyltransferase